MHPHTLAYMSMRLREERVLVICHKILLAQNHRRRHTCALASTRYCDHRAVARGEETRAEPEGAYVQLGLEVRATPARGGVLSKCNNKTPQLPDLGTGGLPFVVNQNGGMIALW